MSVAALLQAAAFGASLNLAWDANVESDVTGYRLHYGTVSQTYTNHTDVGNQTAATITGLAEGVQYFFSVTAYDVSNLESDYSTEVSYTVPKPDTEPPTLLCLSDSVVTLEPGKTEIQITYAVTATDAGASVPVQCEPPSGSTFSAGLHTIVCTAADGAGNTATCSFTIRVNRTPTARPLTGQTGVGQSLVVPQSDLVAGGQDEDGDGLSLAAVSETTAQGGTVKLESGQLTYTPPAIYGGSDSFTYTLTDPYGASASATVTVAFSAVVTGRYVFYNRTAFDGSDSSANVQDDNAIATDKTALRPGQVATFSNYTSFSHGLNGLLLDVRGLAGVPTVADFEFTVGNNQTPSTWTAAPAPSSITIRPSPGSADTTRITLIWPDSAIKKQWLQVKVLATPNTGLDSADVFYFGNAIGESGNSPLNAAVTVIDQALVRANPHASANPATIGSRFDFNRDRFVTVLDEMVARLNNTVSTTALVLLNLSGSLAGTTSGTAGLHGLNAASGTVDPAASNEESTGTSPALSETTDTPRSNPGSLSIECGTDGTMAVVAWDPAVESLEGAASVDGPWTSLSPAEDGLPIWIVPAGEPMLFFRPVLSTTVAGR